MTGIGVPNAGLSLPELEDLRDRAGVFDAITPVWPFDTNLTGGERPERVAALAVSPNYFTLLGARPAMGRLFGRQDEAKGFAEAPSSATPPGAAGSRPTQRSFRSFSNVMAVDGGFDPHDLTVASLWLPAPNDPTQAPYPDQASRNVMIRKLLERLRALPGVRAAAMGGGQSIPLLGFNTATFRVEGKNDQADQAPTAQVAGVTPDYFNVLGIRLLEGRTFLKTDEGQNRVGRRRDDGAPVLEGREPGGQTDRIGATGTASMGRRRRRRRAREDRVVRGGRRAAHLRVHVSGVGERDVGVCADDAGSDAPARCPAT